MTEHIKCKKQWFEPIDTGLKPFTIRKNDRDYKVGNFLIIHEVDDTTIEYTGRTTMKIISYISDYEQKPGYVVLGLHEFHPLTRKKDNTEKK